MKRVLVSLFMGVFFGMAAADIADGADPNCNKKSSKVHAPPNAQRGGPTLNCAGGAMQNGVWVPNGVTWTCPSSISYLPGERKCDGPETKNRHCIELETIKYIRNVLLGCGGADYSCVQTGVEYIPRKRMDTQEWDCTTNEEVPPGSAAYGK